MKNYYQEILGLDYQALKASSPKKAQQKIAEAIENVIQNQRQQMKLAKNLQEKRKLTKRYAEIKNILEILKRPKERANYDMALDSFLESQNKKRAFIQEKLKRDLELLKKAHEIQIEEQKLQLEQMKREMELKNDNAIPMEIVPDYYKVVGLDYNTLRGVNEKNRNAQISRATAAVLEEHQKRMKNSKALHAKGYPVLTAAQRRAEQKNYKENIAPILKTLNNSRLRGEYDARLAEQRDTRKADLEKAIWVAERKRAISEAKQALHTLQQKHKVELLKIQKSLDLNLTTYYPQPITETELQSFRQKLKAVKVEKYLDKVETNLNYEIDESKYETKSDSNTPDDLSPLGAAAVLPVETDTLETFLNRSSSQTNKEEISIVSQSNNKEDLLVLEQTITLQTQQNQIEEEKLQQHIDRIVNQETTEQTEQALTKELKETEEKLFGNYVEQPIRSLNAMLLERFGGGNNNVPNLPPSQALINEIGDKVFALRNIQETLGRYQQHLIDNARPDNQLFIEKISATNTLLSIVNEANAYITLPQASAVQAGMKNMELLAILDRTKNALSEPVPGRFLPPGAKPMSRTIAGALSERRYDVGLKNTGLAVLKTIMGFLGRIFSSCLGKRNDALFPVKGERVINTIALDLDMTQPQVRAARKSSKRRS